MSKTIGSRTLLLERLETRCLLAVGFAEFPQNFGTGFSIHSNANSAFEAPINYFVDPSNHRHSPQLHADRSERLPRYQSFEKEPQLFSQLLVDRLNNNQTPLETVQSQPRRSEPIVQINITLQPSFSDSKNNTGSDSLSIDDSLRPTTDASFSSSTPSLSLAEAQEEVKENVRNATGMPSARSEATQITLSQNPVANNASVTAASTFLSTDRIERLDSISSQRSLSTAPVEEVTGGIIKVAPLFRSEFAPSESILSEIPWELEADHLRQLRSEILNSPKKHDLIDNGATDLAIADWFGHPEGLINDLYAGNYLPAGDISAGPTVLAPTIVDVVLEATVGLYRIADVIGATNATSPSDNVRDEILAAILSETTPIAKLTSPQLSGITECGIVIITSSLTFVRRRRHSNPMHWTGKTT